jgi:hypothetical protein
MKRKSQPKGSRASAVTRALGHQWRLLCAEAVFELFRRAHGREPVDVEEVGRWALTAPDVAKPIDPHLVFTKTEIAKRLGRIRAGAHDDR